MTAGEVPEEASDLKEEARRSSRFPLLLPLEVHWTASNGALIKKEAMAREVNVFGGLLQMPGYPSVGESLTLVNPASNEKVKARAVAMRHAKDGTLLGLAVELEHPSQTFWGVTFELKKASAELMSIEERLRAGGVDLRVLRDFRDAVDYIRKTAWVVYEWQERQVMHRDTATVLPLLVAERIRRATQLHQSILQDIDAHQVSPETHSLADFFLAVERMYHRLTQVFRPDRSS